MSNQNDDDLKVLARRFGGGIPGLEAQLLEALRVDVQATLGFEAGHAVPLLFEALGGLKLIIPARRAYLRGIARERIVVTRKGARPVARVRDNQATTEFLGPALPVWNDLIREAKSNLDAAIPAVGRVELNNSEESWCGTAWLVTDDILVTNRHVAERFARMDKQTTRFVFRAGLTGALISSDIDFLEEERQQDNDEHPITSILWIAGEDEPDVAFLRVSPRAGRKLPRPIRLADGVAEDSVVGAIGYPARDESIPDQRLVIEIFGDGVYDKKRLAPGKVTRIEPNLLYHDCSTLGGNSGSVLVDLKTGAAVGLHCGGFLDDSSNIAVPAERVRELLERALQRYSESASSHATTSPPSPVAPTVVGPVIATAATPGTYKLCLTIPIEIEVRVGVPQLGTNGSTAPHGGPGRTSTDGNEAESQIAAAVRIGTEQLANDPNVLGVRSGYRFKNGWITDEPAVVVLVRSKLSYADVRGAGMTLLPREINGIAVDVRTAPLVKQLDALGIDTAVFEKPSNPAGYREPPGYDDPDSEMYLARIREPMDACFHVSPDAGFRELKGFILRARRHLTATMYEWDAPHISDEIARSVNDRGVTLRMITQKSGTEESVTDMMERVGEFDHVWASVTGRNRLIQRSYHIKVASRDDEEVWLSSGNWKDSNQPVDPRIPAALTRFNRDWHAIIKSERLATLFKRYIEFDFDEAVRIAEMAEEVPFVDVELFVPNDVVKEAARRPPEPTYEDTLVISNERLDIQPLLTPDHDPSGARVFMRVATELVGRATQTLYIQNQSLSFTDDNNREFDGFFEAVRAKQQEIEDVRIIVRDAAEYGGDAAADQQQYIETLKDFGLDVSPDALRLQPRCHTKAIMVDGREVLLGSHNLTNMGCLHNRDASLLVRSEKVTTFYERIFLYDWEYLAHNRAEERTGGVRRARSGEETPAGFTRVKLSQLLHIG